MKIHAPKHSGLNSIGLSYPRIKDVASAAGATWVCAYSSWVEIHVPGEQENLPGEVIDFLFHHGYFKLLDDLVDRMTRELVARNQGLHR